MSTGVTGAIEVDVAGWDRQVKDLARRYGVMAKDVVWAVHGWWTKDLIKHTPPKTYAQGRKRVAKDINKIFVPFKSSYEWWELDPSKGGSIDVQAIAFKSKTGAVYGVEKALFRPNASETELHAHHKRYRRRDGRVTEAGGRSEIGRNTKNIGRWKFVDSMHVPERVLKRYIRSMQKRVGTLKAGWMPAARKFGVSVAKWIQRAERVSGRGVDAMDDNGNGFLESANQVPWASQKLKGVVRFTAQRRQRDFDKHLEKRMKKLAKEWSAA